MEKGEKERPKNALLTAVVGTLLHLAEKKYEKTVYFYPEKGYPATTCLGGKPFKQQRQRGKSLTESQRRKKLVFYIPSIITFIIFIEYLKTSIAQDDVGE